MGEANYPEPREIEITKIHSVLKNLFFLIISSFLFLIVLLYFKEVSLFLSNRSWIGWLMILFAFSIIILSLIQFIRAFTLWYKEQENTEKIMAISAVIIFLLILFLFKSPITKIVENRYPYTYTQLNFQNISYYLEITHEEINLRQLELQIHKNINEQRALNNLPILTYDAQLANIARNHSDDMIVRDYFEHISPDGLNAIDRGNNAGYFCEKNFGLLISKGIAENLALTPIGTSESCGKVFTLNQIANCTVTGWMNSPPHRKNILTDTYDKEGLGIERKNNDFYITQNFC
ncbi:hypothetical protein COU54_02920 [Candidatus Pacearchaeota archaeon CG10_big_fil_rev_8_21_14_0_10_31_24]|nr:MAG: hypothetical protein COU54_02920 [Candidatus Pacearchaeota archaeon CG10_big_fil_rev_8_21_14_0_10_31_24]